jgi:hypothetical protein
MKKVWFKVSDLQNKVGYIIDGWYNGDLQVMDEETEIIYIVGPGEFEVIKEITIGEFKKLFDKN